MCGRFLLTASGEELANLFELAEVPSLEPRYNIAPTQPMAAVRLVEGTSKREWVWLRWGLVPSWSKDPRSGIKAINARSESVAEKPAFRSAFRRRRCLVPASGYYEWRTIGGKKQPYLIGFRDGKPVALAGMWERWKGPSGEVIDSCSVLTTEANELVRSVHDRMPVILEPRSFQEWLDPFSVPADSPGSLLRPFPSERMIVYPVDSWVNNARFEDPACAQPLASA
jgi:putative SOS response-associated peptidase YedK